MVDSDPLGVLVGNLNEDLVDPLEKKELRFVVEENKESKAFSVVAASDDVDLLGKAVGRNERGLENNDEDGEDGGDVVDNIGCNDEGD